MHMKRGSMRSHTESIVDKKSKVRPLTQIFCRVLLTLPL